MSHTASRLEREYDPADHHDAMPMVSQCTGIGQPKSHTVPCSCGYWPPAGTKAEARASHDRHREDPEAVAA